MVIDRLYQRAVRRLSHQRQEFRRAITRSPFLHQAARWRSGGRGHAGKHSPCLGVAGEQPDGTIDDIEHIVVLMQENRSFDHCFGTLRGVRGYGDPRAMRLPSGNPVFYQPVGASYVLPFHPTAPDLGLVFIQVLAHDWDNTHLAWNQGN
jgi:phospholipase C